MTRNGVAIHAENLTKRYGENLAVDHISFEINMGHTVALLGPNGAGKTTTAKMIYCAIKPTDGKLFVNNLDVATQDLEIKRCLGVVPQDNNHDPDLTVLDNLLVYANYFDMPKAEARKKAMEMLEFVELTDRKDQVIMSLSGGMQRRLIVARSLINDPSILILDEPTTGLDPQARHNIWQKVRELKKRGVTVILTTHYMDEAQELADEVFIIDHGKLLKTGSPLKLIRENVGEEVLEMHLQSLEQKGEIESKLSSIGVSFERVADIIYCYKDGESFDKVMDMAFLNSLNLEKYVHRLATLEDVFLKTTGRGLRDQ